MSKSEKEANDPIKDPEAARTLVPKEDKVTTDQVV